MLNPSANATPYYGLDYEGNMVALATTEYSNQAYHEYVERCRQSNDIPKEFILVLSEHQLRAILSQVEAELNDEDGDTLIPTYFVISFSTFLAIFPHASVDTEEEVMEFIRNYPIQVAGPYKLTEIKERWKIN